MQVSDFYNELKNNGINFFCGVPDSLLKDFCAYLSDHCDKSHNIICANEGNAVALAAGCYLSSGNPSLVYMQNSGLGNAVNPLLSLIDEEVYNIPVLFLVGWRGEPDKKDEPQHKKQGKLTLPLLESLQMEYGILSENGSDNLNVLKEALRYIKEEKKSYTLVVRKDAFDKYSPLHKANNSWVLGREEALEIITQKIGAQGIIVSTTGMISRELFEYREHNQQGHQQDFLTVGSMGHASSIALGVALNQPDKTVYCIEGDGAVLMHMGAMAVNASLQPANFKHILLNNEAHDSVGGQPTAVANVNFRSIAKACGYSFAQSVSNREDLINILAEFIIAPGPSFLEIKVKKGARTDLGRPNRTPIENKMDFMSFIND